LRGCPAIQDDRIVQIMGKRCRETTSNGLSPTCKAPRQGRERIRRVLAPSCIPLSCTVDFAADTTAQKKKAVQGGERGECGQRTGV